MSEIQEDIQKHEFTVTRFLNAPRELVYNAWTKADALTHWWGVEPGTTVPIAEIDLRVGGTYRLGMLPPDQQEVTILCGEYKLIQPPEELKFTWRIENRDDSPESLISLRFIDHGQRTEIILKHEYWGTPQMASNFQAGWAGMFARLELTFTENPSGYAGHDVQDAQ